MSAKLIYFNFIGTNGVPDSPCAINASQIVYMYTTQTSKTAVVFTNGDLRVSNDTIQSFKSGQFSQGLGQFVSIGTPRRTGSSAWPSTNGEVLVNSSYISQLTKSGFATLVVMNQPASAPVNFTTLKGQSDIIVESRSNDSPFSFISLDVTQTGTNAPVVNGVYSNVGLATAQVTGTYVGVGSYGFSFPTGVVLNNASVFVSAPTGSAVPIIRATAAEAASSIQVVTQNTSFANANGLLTNTKINVLSWPTLGRIPQIGDRSFGGVIFHVDTSTKKAYVLYENVLSTGIVWSTPQVAVTGVNIAGAASGSVLIASSSTNTSLIATTATGTGASVDALAFSATVEGVTYTDWVLPSRDALLAIHSNLRYASGDPFNIASYVPVDSIVWASNQSSTANGVVVPFSLSTPVPGGQSKSFLRYALVIREQQF